MIFNCKTFVTKDGAKREIKSKTIKLGNVYCKYFIKSHRKGTVYRTIFDEPIHLTNDDSIELVSEMDFE